MALETTDLDQAHQYVHDVFTPHKLVFRGSPAVDLHLRYAASTQLTVSQLSYGSDVKVDVPPPETAYHLALPLRGACVIRQGRDIANIAAGEHGAMMSADDPLDVHWSPDAHQYILKISQESVSSQLSRMTGRSPAAPVRFDLRFSLNTGAAQALLACVDFLWHELERPGGLSVVPVAREHLERCVLAQLLATIPHDHAHLLSAPAAVDQAGCIPQLIEYIDQHADAELTTSSLAKLAGITERALQLGFRKAVGTTPSAYVRGVRLDRVREELCGGGHGATITDVAMRWGFYHPSRFAQQYRERFGVLPSHTVEHDAG
jgi:AraC-like DNA-binding protein